MSRRYLGWILAVGCLAVGCLAVGGSGCSNLPPPPEEPEIDPGKAGAAAIGKYDVNGDGKLDAAELKNSPPLQLAKKRIDANRDGMLTADEISARVRYWLDCGATLFDGTTSVTLDGRPLQEATVTFEPEEFLGPAFTSCKGVTNQWGEAYIEGPDPEYPGIYFGLYRVKISKVVGGRETIPARYNTQTELAHEATDDIEGVGSIEFHLRSR